MIKMLTSFDFYLSLNKTWALLSAGRRQNELLYISIHDLRCEGAFDTQTQKKIELTRNFIVQFVHLAREARLPRRCILGRLLRGLRWLFGLL